MAERSDTKRIVRGADGTSDRTFRATGIAEHWRSPDMGEQGEIFTQEDFQKVLKKVARKVKK